MKDTHFEFEVDGKRIPAALTVPSNSPSWCVVLVPGSGPSDIDGNFPEGGMWPGRTNVLRDLATQFGERDVACLRYSRANMTTTDPEKALAFKRFEHRAAVVNELCKIARERSGAASIAIAGHSEGSVVGSMTSVLYPQAKVDAYISLSGPAYRFYDLMLRGAERRAVDGVLQMGPMKMPLALYHKAVMVAREGTAVPEELNELPFGFHKMDPDSQKYLRDYDAVDNREMIAQIGSPVLIVQGGADESVWFENGELLVKSRRKSLFTTDHVFFSDLDHFYKKTGSESVDPRVATAVVDWLRVCRS